MKKKSFLTLLLLFSTAHLHAQNNTIINEYNSLYNEYASCAKKKSIVAPWLLNGRFVDYGEGEIRIKLSNGLYDTIPFIYHKGNMVFYESNYNKLLSYENDLCHDSKHNLCPQVQIVLNCFVLITDSIYSYIFETTFPLDWIICYYIDDQMYSTVYRITIDSKGNYIVSIDTYGYYLSYGIINERHSKKIKKHLLKKHLKKYGRY